MSILAEYRKKYTNVEGWFNQNSQAIWDCLLSFQTGVNIRGHMLEIGVWQGKSAALSLLHARENEKCLLVDPRLNPTIEKRLGEIGKAECVFLQFVSDALNTPKFIGEWAQRFRWVHIDGEHSGMAVKTDLTIADALLHRQGIVALDDFLSPCYPQITQAVFRYLDANPGSFSLFLCGFGKGYLCRPISAPTIRAFIQKDLLKGLEERDAGQFSLWRSTVPDDLSTFGIIERENNTAYRGPDWAPSQVFT